MSTEGEIKGRLVLDSDQFRRDVLAAREQLHELTSTRTDVKVGADTERAKRGLDGVAKSANAVAVAEARLKAAVQASDRATAVALLAQMRLKDVQEKRGRTALQVAAAEEALRFATQKSDNAATKATVAEESLAAAHRDAAKAAVEHAAAEETVEGAIDRVSRRADSGAGRIALWTSAIIAAAPALFPIAGLATAGAVALGGLGSAAVLAALGVKRTLNDGSDAADRWNRMIDGTVDSVHDLQDTAAKGVLPGAEKTFDRLQLSMPMVNRGIAEMADDLGRMAPVGLDAVLTLSERGVPLWRSGADWLGRMVQGLDDFAHSDAYKGFIDYTIRNGPRTEQFLLHVLQLVGDIIQAWAPYGEAVLPVLDDTVTTVGQIIKALGPLVPAAAAVYLGFRAWTGIRTIISGINAGLLVMGARSTAAGAAANAGGLSAAAGWAAAGLALSQYARVVAAQANYDNAYKLTTGSQKQKLSAAGDASRASMVAPAAAGGGGMVLPGMDQAINDSLRQASAQKRVSSATDQATAAARRQATAVEQLRSALDQATRAANDAATAQDKLATTAQDVEGSQLNAKNAIAAAGKAIQDNGTDLRQSTEAGRANREMILSATSSISSYGQSLVKSGSSALEARVAEEKLAVSLEDTLVKMGMGRSAAAAYIAKLLGIPKNVTTRAQLKKDQAQAALDRYRAEVFALDGYTATVYVALRQTGLSPDQATRIAKNPGTRINATGGTAGIDDWKHALKSIPAHASGATVTGHGTAASDSVLRWLSVGEEVTSNLRGQASKNRPMLKAINSGDDARIRRTAAEQYGTGQAPVLRIHFTDDGSDRGREARAIAEQVVAEYDAAAHRTARMGYMNKSLLAGAGS